MRQTLLIFAPMALATVASATQIIDDYSTASGVNQVISLNTGECNGPSSATHLGTNIMGGSGTRIMDISRTSGSGTGCVQAQIDLGNNNVLEMNSGFFASGTTTVHGQIAGANVAYTVQATDTVVSFLAAHDLTTTVNARVTVSLHLSGTGAIPGGTYVSAPAVAITTAGLTQYTINLGSFAGINAGTQIDGYRVMIEGGVASDVIVDQVCIGPNSAGSLGANCQASIPGTTGTSAVPEPSTLILMGAGLAGIAFLRRRR